MLVRSLLVTLLLLTLSIGSQPAAAVWLSGDDDSNQHSSDQPFTDGEEEIEKSKAEWDQLEALYSGLLTTDVERQPSLFTIRYDQPDCFIPLVLSSPDHSRAPPARA